MATDLATLQALLAQSSIAKGRVPELEAQLARANALRDTPAPTATQQLSYTSPLSHLARGFNQIRGQDQVTRATGGLSQARQQLAESDAGQTMYGLETDASRRTEDVDFRALKEGNIAKRALTKSLADQAAAKLAYDNKVAETKRQEDYTQGQFGEHETVWKTEDNTPLQVAIADDGKSYINVHTGETITEPFTTQNPYAKGGALYTAAATGQSGIPYQQVKGKDAQGNEVVGSFDKRDGKFTPTQFTATGETWTPELASKHGGEIVSQVGAEVLSKEESKANIKGREAASAKLKSLYALENEMNTSLNALDAGADTGPLASKFPSWSASAIALDNSRDRMALNEIGSYTFGSLSDAEGQWLKNVSIPLNMDENELRPWLAHRKQGIQNTIEATKYELDMLEAGLKPNTKIIQNILHTDGFKFEDIK